MAKFKILFMGTTNFSEEILKTLISLPELEIVGVVCQPDRKIGRKQIISFSPVKNLALTNNITLFQPDKIIDIKQELIQLKIDVIVTCAYGQFLPKPILNVPKIKCLNIHASLLPQLRGGAPIQWAIIRGLSETGITLMDMISKMDAGSYYVQEAVQIDNEETYFSLNNKLIGLAKAMLKKYFLVIITGKIIPILQDESKVTFGFNIKREDEKINWKQTSQAISCHVRGLYNVPIAYTILQDKVYKIHEVKITNKKSELPSGTITAINKNGIVVATTTNDLIITVIQPAGKKVLRAVNYHGNKEMPIVIGMRFE